MNEERIATLAKSLRESDYKDHRDLFISIAKSRYPRGFKLLKKAYKIPKSEQYEGYTHEIRFNEVVLMLFQFLQIEFEGKDSDLREAVFIRIIEDIVSD
jgi:uncharacterized protein YPO0396